MAYTNQVSNYGSYKYIVTGSRPGPFHTIQAAITQAHTDGATTTIFVQPGTYAEDLTLYDGINIQGSQEGEVIINGIHTPPSSGTFSVSSVQLASATDIFSSSAAGTTTLTVTNCLFNLTAGYVFDLANWTGDLIIDNCTETSTRNYIVTNTASAALDIKDSAIGAGTTTLTCSGVTRIFNSRIFCPVTFASAADVLVDGGSRIDAAVTTSGTATVSIMDSVISSGSSSAIVHNSTNLLTLSNVTIDSSSSTVIDGTGTIELGEVVYTNSNTVIGTISYNNDSELQCSKLIANDSALVTTGNLTIGAGKLYLGESSGTNGEVPIAATGAAPAWASITAGSNISITTGANSITIAATGISTVLWEAISADGSLAVNTGYYNTKASTLLTATLPTTAAAGSVIYLQGTAAANSWKIAQNAGQHIQYGTVSTTTGTGGYLASSNTNDGVMLLCVVANTTFQVVSSIGNITYV
jgi:hypothetical protein